MNQPSVIIVYDRNATLISLSFLSKQGFNAHFIKLSQLTTKFLLAEKPQVLLFDISIDTLSLFFQNSLLEDFLFKSLPNLAVLAITQPEFAGLWKQANVNETIMRPFHYSTLLAKIHKHVYENFINSLQNLHQNEAYKNKTKKFDRL